MAAPQLALLHHPAAAAPEQRRGVADPEGLEPLQLSPELRGQLRQVDPYLRFQWLVAAVRIPPVLGQHIQALVQFAELFGPHGEAAGGWMAPMAFEQLCTGLQGRIHSKPLWSAHGSPQPAISLAGQQGHRQAEMIHQSRGHDADHTVVPVALCQQQERAALLPISLHQGPGLRLDGIAELTALAVQALALAGQLQGALLIRGGQQIHHQLWIPQPAHGVDAGSDLEAHGRGVDRYVIKPSHLLQGLQTHQGAPLEPG